MFGLLKRTKIGFVLLASSIRVLWKHPKLVVLPVISAICSIGYFFALVVSVPPWLVDNTVMVYGLLILFYAGTTFIASFFNATLVYCTARAFNGQPPSIREGMAAAWQKKRLLAAWALIAAVVGLILRLIEESSDLLGKLVALVVGVAWAIMTFFVVPIIVFEDVSVRELFSRSSGLIKQTWGESFAATGALGVVLFVCIFSGSVLGALVGPTLLVVLPRDLATFALIGSFLPIFLLGILGYFVGSTLSSITKAALYVYASQGVVPSEFENAGSVFDA
ncbi:MAG: DUF6159 family protein [Halorientalis sp.]